MPGFRERIVRPIPGNGRKSRLVVNVRSSHAHLFMMSYHLNGIGRAQCRQGGEFALQIQLRILPTGIGWVALPTASVIFYPASLTPSYFCAGAAGWG